ncbi:hypothetical protein ANTHELSMS3_00123 [Antarctobacter heliothermus]|uniref:Uncharacterized protein n=1 Tax=Antarctobacter heliothermus TaxID=74033 RepID=A0A222DY17_9RHOB|nr:hypothetical protein ANTHELSMS3_00123 [Antarctobacter heliothermus]
MRPALSGDVSLWSGFESGAELDHALSAGFQAVGKLRILAAKGARF